MKERLRGKQSPIAWTKGTHTPASMGYARVEASIRTRKTAFN